METYVFVDVWRDPPDGNQIYYANLIKEIESIKYSEFKDEYSLFLEISRVLKTVHDAHLFLLPPCYELISYALPFAFLPSLEGGNQSRFTIRFAETVAKEVQEYWVNTLHHPNLVGKRVLRLSTTGQEADLKDILKVLDDFASDSIFSSKNPTAQLNQAIGENFCIRYADEYKIPNSPYLVEYFDDDANTTQLENISWFGYISSLYLHSDLSVCPGWKLNRSPSIPRNSASHSDLAFGVDSFRPSFSIRDQLFDAMDAGDLEAMTELSDLMIGRSFLFYGFPGGLLAEAGEEECSSEEEDRLEDSFLAKPGNPINNGLRGNPNPVVFGGFEDNTTFYLRVRSFSGNLKKIIADDIIQAAKSMFGMNAKRLVLDLRGNPGGNIGLAMDFLSFFFPQTVPLHLLYHLRKDPSGVTAGYFRRQKVSFTDPRTGKPVNEAFLNESVMYTFHDTHDEDEATFERPYSLRYAKDWDNPLSFEDYLASLSDYPGYEGCPLFAPHSVLVLTDGNCGSACAQIVKKIKQVHAAKIIAVGSAPLSRDLSNDADYLASVQSTYEIGAFAGGFITNWNITVGHDPNRLATLRVCSDAAYRWDEDDNASCLVVSLFCSFSVLFFFFNC